MLFDPYLEAKYSDGFVVEEDPDNDESAFVAGKNTFDDILHKRYEEEHGALETLSLICPEHSYSVDFTALPFDARPVRFKSMQRQFDAATFNPLSDAVCTSITFGYSSGDTDHAVTIVMD